MNNLESKFIAKVIQYLEKLGYPIFSDDITDEEIKENKNFWIYKKGKTFRKERTYLKQLFLIFSTRNEIEIEELEVIEALEEMNLIFKESFIDEIKIKETEEKNSLLTLEFSFPIGTKKW